MTQDNVSKWLSVVAAPAKCSVDGSRSYYHYSSLAYFILMAQHAQSAKFHIALNVQPQVHVQDVTEVSISKMENV